MKIGVYRSGKPLRHPRTRAKAVNRCATQEQEQKR
jgi:hypothetical protein